MFDKLRTRFILSHILPILIILPVMGVAMVYLIEQQIIIPSLVNELKSNALILSRLAAHEQDIWTSPDYAAHLLTQGSFNENGRLMLLDHNKILLASSNPADSDRIGTPLDLPGIDDLPEQQVVTRLIYSNNLQEDIADAVAKVIGSDGQILGYIRLSYHRVSMTDQIFQLRYILTGIQVSGLLFGALLGVILAVNVSAPITKVTLKVDALANGGQDILLPEVGAAEIRSLSRAVNMLVERLQNLETARKHLLANLVHEIGRPLGALRMGIEALAHGANQDAAFYAELLAGMDQETARLQQLLNDLAHLYETILGPLKLNLKPLHLATWLPEMLISWQQAAAQKNLHWELVMPDNLPDIQADALRLGQVVGNLVSNAIKFTPSGGSLTIAIRLTDGRLGILVSDTGPGISPELGDKIFTPFVRGDSGVRFPQGMGLGLSIARELAEAHGGRLEYESQPGMGATFIVWLPV